MRGYPRGTRGVLLTVLALVLVSGVALVPATLAVRFELALPAALSGWPRGPWVTVHAVAAAACTAFTGALWGVHMRAGWARRARRISGALTASMLVLLAVSALVVSYAGSDAAAAVAAVVHTVLGIAGTVAFVWHWRRRRTRVRR